MASRHGFTLTREEFIDEYGISARLYTHDKTGAELLSLSNRDENKVFGITFRTPPDDSTGVAHILEHSVLCGSRKYPLKEPFVELLKGSLQTFLNAFTYPDKTCYPIASQNLQDFYNLVDIYMDAALHPLLDRHTFDQEAWHYELNNPHEALIYKGVVFNEMKGVYASPDNLLAEQSQRILYPDITYGHDYGGDPRHIPDLTWSQLVAFHRKFYHPSNARIYFYGDDDVDERLRRMDIYLSEYEHARIDSAIPLQPFRENLPRLVRMPYPAGENDEESTLYLTVNWRLDDCRNIEEMLGLHLLDDILTDTPASPLRKALIDSNLGEDLTGAGLETQIRQCYFSTGLKGIARGNEDKVTSLIEKTLQKLLEDGIDPKTIEAAINTAEFEFRELNTGNYPRGLSLMIAAMQTWLYDGDPLEPIRYARPLATIKERISRGDRYFEELMRKHLIDNPNRAVLILEPDAELKERMDRAESATLAEIKSSWTDSQVDEVIRKTRELKERQAKPDGAEALKCIPSLARSDLPKANKVLPIDISSIEGTPFLFHELDTAGITYLDLGLNLQVVPDHLLSLVPVWARALLETGTKAEDYVELTQRIGRLTGGISPELYSSTVAATNEATAWIFVRGKAIHDRFRDLLSIIGDVFQSARLDNQDRIRQLILEEKAEIESNIVPSGHRFVSQRLRATFNLADWIQEHMTGITYLESIRRLAHEVENDWDHLHANLLEIHTRLLNRSNMLVNLTVNGAMRTDAASALAAFLSHIEPRAFSAEARSGFAEARRDGPEGLVIPAQVNYVGKAVNLHHLGMRVDGHALVINRYLRTAWLWDQVRVQGGAYGAFSAIDHRSGQLSMVSYRDPNVAGTLEIYDRTCDYLRQLNVDATEIDRAVIGAIGDLDTYLLPDAKGFVSLGRYLAGDSEAARQKLREEILSTTLDHFHAFGEQIAALANHGRVAAMGSKDKLLTVPGIRLTNVL